MAISTTTGSCSTGCALTCGTSMRMEWLSNGAVMMKITSSTSITSISGTMLISDIVLDEPLESKPPNAMSGSACGGRRQIDVAPAVMAALGHLLAGGQKGEQIMGEGIQVGQV